MTLMGDGFEPNRLRSRMREDEYDNQDAASGDDDQDFAGDKNSKKKKKYNRHTPYQIQELEAFFKVNQHPEEKDRLELGRRLSLDSRQVKFWFQNRRTQLKTQVERHENSLLRRQNEELLLENLRMKEVLRNPACTNCGGPATLGDLSVEEQHLRIENSRLRDEINRMSALAERFLGRPVSSLVGPSVSPFDISNSSSLELAMGTNGLIISSTSLDTKEMVSAPGPLLPFHPATPPTNNPYEKSIFLDLAEKSMEELVKLVQADDSLWIRNGSRGIETLNLEEYTRLGTPCLGIKSEGYSINATRTSGTVVASSLSIAESLMDGNQWADMFPCIIGKTTIIDIIQRGPTTCTINGALHMMYAELQGLSPLIPVRAVKFLRFCKQLAEGVWGVVDVSVDGSHEVSESHVLINCMRLPSGCVVQDMANGCSKVTWVEHLEFEENGTLHPLLGSGSFSCFGAERWLASLQRQCQCLEILTAPPPISTEDHHSGSITITPSGKRSMINLAHRMTRSFCFGVCSTVHPWQLVQVSNMGEESRLTIRNNSTHNPGEPSGVVLSATTSVWMSVSHQCLFEFLRSEQLRSEWDELAYDRPMQEMARVNKSNDGINCVSLLRSTVPNSTNQNAMVILQETQTDGSGSVIAYAAVDVQAMQMVMDGGESGSVAILPSGFAIIPSEGGSCLMTVGFQILVNSPANAKLTVESVETVNSLMFRRIQRIKSALGCA